MSTAQLPSPRDKRLTQIFYNFIQGRQSLLTSQDASHFLEAACLVNDGRGPTAAMELLVASKNGLDILKTAVRANLQSSFIVTSVMPLIKHIANPGVKTIGNGHFLMKILNAILDPPTFWSSLLQVHQDGKLRDDSLKLFAWLCFEIISSQSDNLKSHKEDVEKVMRGQSLFKAASLETRTLAQRIQKVIRLRTIKPSSLQYDYSPGGRHDNDFSDFRQILIYPTNDEVLSKEKPFLQRLDDVFETPMDIRPRTYLDWLYRLLREDMLADIRESLQDAWGSGKRKRRTASWSCLKLVEGDNTTRPTRPYLINLYCGCELQYLEKSSEEKKTKMLKSPNAIFKHNSFGALCLGSNVIAFGTLVKDEKALRQAQFGFQVFDSKSLSEAIAALIGVHRQNIKLFFVDTPTFAYEPILRRLQGITELPLEHQLIDSKAEDAQVEQTARMGALIDSLQNAMENRQTVALKPSPHLRLGGAQLESIINGLKNRLALIQGPPGTGKSFIGAILVWHILKMTNQRVLVLSYTNHALDQFIEDLVEIGVDEDYIVRLGSKFSAKTQSMRVEERLKSGRYRSSPQVWGQIKSMQGELSMINAQLIDERRQLVSEKIDGDEVLAFLEFSLEDGLFKEAFQLPELDDGFQFAQKGNRSSTPRDLYNSWLHGMQIEGLGYLAALLSLQSKAVWALPQEQRSSLHAKWTNKIRAETMERFLELNEQAKEIQSQIDDLYNESKRKLLQGARLISCTTTGASIYQSIIKTAQVDVVVVEEAGEILEAHIVAALNPSVKQIILIGDHKQLRPKVNNYSLTIEKGDGYDLNVSLFERLIKQGRPFSTLQEQHRSHPEISQFSRLLAYPMLKDGLKTGERKAVRGLSGSGRVVFVHHEYAEEEMSHVADRGEPGSKSKRNKHEAQMVLKTIKYLSQQGYKTDDMVVLTPYLGQLSLLRDELSDQNDPYLNDLDDHDLLRAGLISNASTKVKKRPLRLSTIDNYQGEESDIVIASLTRSNSSGDIGFLYARERLVVLMSRAKSSIILFGNMHTFVKSKKGHDLWQKYFDALEEKKCLFLGLPVYCERHQDRSVTLMEPSDFDQYCPDGGCAEACGAKLKCGKHTCERRCHRLQDHSNAPCMRLIDCICDRGHKYKSPCGENTSGCRKCVAEDKETRRRALRDLEMEKKRQERQDRYTKELQEVDDEIDSTRRAMKYETEKEDQAKSLAQKRAQLKSLKDSKARVSAVQASIKNAQAAASSKSSTHGGGGKASAGSNSPLTGVKDEWEYVKKSEGAQNEALDDLMSLIGLESVQEEFMSIKSSIDLKILQGVPLSGERLSCSLLGNPGTGKTTVARLWAKFLTTTGAIPGDTFKETTGAKLASDGVKGCESMLEEIKNDGGGVLFIDEAYQLSSGNSAGSKAVLDYLLAEVENLRGKVVFVLAGYNKEMESFFAHNPGMPSRFPITMKFEDYTDEELLKIFQLQLDRKFRSTMSIEDGQDGLYARIVARRIGKGRGNEGFGNARAVENTIANILKRQANRLRHERKANTKSDNLLLTRLDLIGPEPSQALDKCLAWTKLNEMIGLDKVKQQLKVFRDVVTTNYERELAEELIIEFTLNRVFVGSPGTGKTTVAKLYGQLLSHLGLLTNGEVVVKNPSDFMGSALGQSEANTKGILAATLGKVLVIDEAYGLYGGSSVADPYKSAVIDTIVAEVQSVPGDDRCVLLLGYQDQMENMFQNVNPGLSRRFPMSSAFEFEDFDDAAMAQIFDMKLKASAFKATGQAKGVAMDVLKQARNRPNFGNAGEVDILLNRAKGNYQKRMSEKQGQKGALEAKDFDEDFERSTRRGTDVAALFKGDIGREKVIELLQGYQVRVRELKALDMDPKEEIPFSFLFRGPPGTGKTTTARKMGKVYYDMGFLASAEVIECSATELIGQYVGQTGPKVQQLLEKAMGKVLFIDEAYRLAGGGFAKEAVDELVDSITKPKFQGKMIIILAGYVNDINNLLSINPGMSSRFPETIDFASLSEDNCIQLLASLLEAKKKQLAEKGKIFDLSCLESPSQVFRQELLVLFRRLSEQEGWASARDVNQLAKAIFRGISLSNDQLHVDEGNVEAQLQNMLNERGARMAQPKATEALDSLMQTLNLDQKVLKTTVRSETTTQVAEEIEEEESEPPPEQDESALEPSDESHYAAVRDAGVSDEVWEQLTRDKAAQIEREIEYQKLKDAHKKAQGAARERIIRQLVEEEERRKKAEATQAKLKALGICPAGFEWIKGQGGYRCAGGAHWMNDEQVSQL